MKHDVGSGQPRPRWQSKKRVVLEELQAFVVLSPITLPERMFLPLLKTLYTPSEYPYQRTMVEAFSKYLRRYIRGGGGKDVSLCSEGIALPYRAVIILA
jgi:hypothetical protein